MSKLTSKNVDIAITVEIIHHYNEGYSSHETKWAKEEVKSALPANTTPAEALREFNKMSREVRSKVMERIDHQEEENEKVTDEPNE